MAAGPERGRGRGRDGDGSGDSNGTSDIYGSGDQNCAFFPAGSPVQEIPEIPEIFPGLLLTAPGAGNQPVEQPGSSPENNAPEIFRCAVNGPWGVPVDAGNIWSAFGALRAGGDPGRLAEILKQTGFFWAGPPPGAAVTPAAGDIGQYLQSLLALLWPAETFVLPPGQEKTGQTGDSGVSFGPAGIQIKPAEELNRFNNLLREIFFFFRQQGEAGLAGPEGNTGTLNSILASGLKEALATAKSAGAQTKGAGSPDSGAAAALLRQALAALLALREQTGPETFRGSSVLAGSGEDGGAANPGLEPAAGQQVQSRLPAEIIRPEGFPAALQSSGGEKQPYSPFASVNRPVLPEALFPGEKGLSAGIPGKEPASSIFNFFYGNSAAEAVYPGGGQGSVTPSLIPALVSQALQQAAGKSLAGETRLRFRLEPEHLGELVIRLVYRSGEVSAYFQASSAQAKEVLEHSLPQLREALAGQNLHLQNASVSVGQQESEFLARENYGQAGYNYLRRGGGSQEPEADRSGSGPEQGRAPGYGRVNLCI